MPREDVVHESGPFQDIRSGDVIRVIYEEMPAAHVLVTRVKQHALLGMDGDSNCKVTIVSPTELRFYGALGPNRTTALRNVQVVKISEQARSRE